MGIFDGPGNLYGLTKKINFIDSAEAIAKKAKDSAENMYSTVVSAEKFINKLPDMAIGYGATAPIGGPAFGAAFGALGGGDAISKLLGFNTPGSGQLGTKTGEAIEENTPFGLGGVARMGFDIAGSPLTIATAGGGSGLAASLKGIPVAGKGLSMLASPIAKSGIGPLGEKIAPSFLARYGAEVATGLGAGIGATELPKLLPEDAPGAAKLGTSLIGGLLGGGAASAGFNKAFKPPTTKQPTNMEMVFQKGRLPGDENKRFIPKSTPDWGIHGKPSWVPAEYPEDLAKDRLWAHATTNTEFDLLDPEVGFGGASGMSQGGGLTFMAADPNKITWAGNRLIISVADDSAKIMNMGAPADWTTWHKVSKSLGIDNIELNNAIVAGRYSQFGASLNNANNFNVRDAIVEELLHINAVSKWSPMAESASNNLKKLLSSEWQSKAINADPENLARTVINEKLGKNGIDAFFYRSSHEDEVLAVINGEKFRQLNKSLDVNRIPHDQLVGKSYKEIAAQAMQTGRGRAGDRVTFEPSGVDDIRGESIKVGGQWVDTLKQNEDGSFSLIYEGSKFLTKQDAKNYINALWATDSIGYPLKPLGKQKLGDKLIDFASGNAGNQQRLGITADDLTPPPTTPRPALAAAPLPDDPEVIIKKGGFQTVNDNIRAVSASLDNSVEGIQNLLGYTVAHPIESAKIFAKTFKALIDPDVDVNFQNARDAAILSKRAAGENAGKTFSEWYDINNKLFNRLYETPGIGGATEINRLPAFRQTARAFNSGANMMRRAMLDTIAEQAQTKGLWQWMNVGGAAMKNPQDYEAIAKAVMRATGASEKGLGKFDDAFFAPKFLRATAELFQQALVAPILRAAKEGPLSPGSIEEELARRQLAKVFGAASLITYIANEARGEETVWDPTDSNFLRIRNIAGVDISLLAYLDTAVRGVALASKGLVIDPAIAAAKGENIIDAGSPEDAIYLLRSKASPLVGLAIDLISGETFSGESPYRLSSMAKNVLPFNIRNTDIPGVDLGEWEGKETPGLNTALGLLGVKATPLSGTERLNQTLSRAGIKPDDPNYEILRRNYLFQHPDDLPEVMGNAKTARDITQGIQARGLENEQALQSGKITVKEWRDNRSTILQEQRDKLSMLDLGGSSRNSQQKQWIDSYFKVFDTPGVKDPISGKIVAENFDTEIAKWSDTHPGGLTYMQNYLYAGKNPVEKEYSQAINKLSDLGYFSMNRYRGMTSGLSSKQIDKYRNEVSAIKSATPELKDVPFASVARLYLQRQGLTMPEILDIVHAGSDSYASKEFVKFKREHQDLLQWLNPNATWASIQAAKSSKSGVRSPLLTTR